MFTVISPSPQRSCHCIVSSRPLANHSTCVR